MITLPPTHPRVEHPDIYRLTLPIYLGYAFLIHGIPTPQHLYIATMASQSLEKDTRKDSEASLPLSTSTTSGASSMQDFRHSSSGDDEPDWPRTWRAYACLLGCFFLMFNSWGLVNAYGTWSSYYVGYSLRTVDQLELNLIGGSQCFLVLLLSNPVGRLLDAGHFRKVICFGTVFVPLGLFILSAVHPSNVEAIASFGPIWATQGLIVGFGMAPFFVSSSQGKSIKLQASQ